MSVSSQARAYGRSFVTRLHAELSPVVVHQFAVLGIAAAILATFGIIFLLALGAEVQPTVWTVLILIGATWGYIVRLVLQPVTDEDE